MKLQMNTSAQNFNGLRYPVNRLAKFNFNNHVIVSHERIENARKIIEDAGVSVKLVPPGITNRLTQSADEVAIKIRDKGLKGLFQHKIRYHAHASNLRYGLDSTIRDAIEVFKEQKAAIAILKKGK